MGVPRHLVPPSPKSGTPRSVQIMLDEVQDHSWASPSWARGFFAPTWPSITIASLRREGAGRRWGFGNRCSSVALERTP